MVTERTNRRILLRRRPDGAIAPADYAIAAEPIALSVDGDALIATRLLAIDPVTRVMLGADIGMMPPIAVGAAIRGFGVGEVIETSSRDYPIGAQVCGFFEWADFQSIRATPHAALVPDGVSAAEALNLYGHTAHAAYFGMIEVGKVSAGETVVVTGAAGSVGSIAAQIARIIGARVFGTAGSDEKRRWLVQELGLAGAIDYHNPLLDVQLDRLLPDGIDCIFDNVGGPLLDLLIGHLRHGGRVVQCGTVAQYEGPSPLSCTHDQAMLAARGAVLLRFNAMNYGPRLMQASAEMAGWERAGLLHVATRIITGLEAAPTALNSLFAGGNRGRLLVEIDRAG